MAEFSPPSSLLEFLSSHDTYYLVTHSEPDADCLASSLALGHYLERNGKRVKHFNEGPFIRSEIRPLEPLFRDTLTSTEIQNDVNPAAVVLDCSTRERVGSFADVLDQVRVAVIDHHAGGEPFGDVIYVDTDAASTTVLIQAAIETSGSTPDKQEAELIFFGLSTDTGFFRHLDFGSGRAFRAAGRLVDAGASPKETYNRMFGGKNMESRRLLARLLQRTETYLDGRIALTYERQEDTAEFGRQNRDSDSLYQLLMGTQECTVVGLIREESKNSCTGSLRSSDDVDVSLVARSFGGGGHKRAAGFLLEAPLEQTYERVKEALIGLVSDSQEPPVADGATANEAPASD